MADNDLKRSIRLWRDNALARLGLIGVPKVVAELVLEEPLLEGSNQNLERIREYYATLSEAEWRTLGEKVYQAFSRTSPFRSFVQRTLRDLRGE